MKKLLFAKDGTQLIKVCWLLGHILRLSVFHCIKCWKVYINV